MHKIYVHFRMCKPNVPDGSTLSLLLKLQVSNESSNLELIF